LLVETQNGFRKNWRMQKWHTGSNETNEIVGENGTLMLNCFQRKSQTLYPISPTLEL